MLQRVFSYEPKLERFVQADPIGYVDGLNLYEYVNSNPTNWIDPFGLESFGGTATDGLPSSGGGCDTEGGDSGDVLDAVFFGLDLLDYLGITLDVLSFPSGEALAVLGLTKGIREGIEKLAKEGVEKAGKGKPKLRKPGSRVNPDGTQKNVFDQVDQISKTQKRNRKAIESIEKSKQNAKNFLEQNKNNLDAFDE